MTDDELADVLNLPSDRVFPEGGKRLATGKYFAGLRVAPRPASRGRAVDGSPRAVLIDLGWAVLSQKRKELLKKRAQLDAQLKTIETRGETAVSPVSVPRVMASLILASAPKAL
jgi:hypothetical protein